MNEKRPHNKQGIVWLITLAILAFSPSCSSHRRLQKALIALDQDELNSKRAWPYNYNFSEYSQHLDEALLRQEFYRERGVQARKAGDKRMQAIMENNVEQYQKTIDRLKSDKEFYKVYKLQAKQMRAKQKEENQEQKALDKQKLMVDKNARKRQKEVAKKKKQNLKQNKKLLKDKEKRLKEQQKKHLKKQEETEKLIKEKQKELALLEEVAQESGVPDDPSFVEERERLTTDLERLERSYTQLENDIESLNVAIDKFTPQNDSPQDSTTIAEKDSLVLQE